MRFRIVSYLTLALAANTFFQALSNPNNAGSMTSPYPFEIAQHDGQYSIIAQIESEEIFKKYSPIFERNGYSGNGYCWEGHIIQILEKTDKELLNHIEFDPEAGAFYAYADSKNSQLKFIDVVSPIFADLKKLEQYIKLADRDRIDD